MLIHNPLWFRNSQTKLQVSAFKNFFQPPEATLLGAARIANIVNATSRTHLTK